MTEQTATEPSTPTPSQFSLRHAQRRIRKNADELRRLADDFDRIAGDLDTVPSPGRSFAGEVAGRIIHEHAVWLMNAQLHSAVLYAADADRIRASARPASREEG